MLDCDLAQKLPRFRHRLGDLAHVLAGPCALSGRPPPFPPTIGAIC